MVSRKETGLHRLLVWMFIISMLVNVQPAFACTMMANMPDVPYEPESNHDCCPGRQDFEKKPPLSPNVSLANVHTISIEDEPCFSYSASLQLKSSLEADADPGNDHLILKDKHGTDDLTLRLAFLILTIAQDPVESSLNNQRPESSRSPSIPVYIFTQRYRI